MTKFIKKAFTVSVVVTTIFWAVGLAALLPVGASAAAVEGDLIKMSGLSSVYYYAGGKRDVFPNEATYFSWYSDFSSVKTISQAELESIPLGTNVVMRPGTKLVKITTDPKVYAVGPDGVLHHVDSEARATTLYGANWASRVVDVPDAFFTNYTVGTALSSDVHPEGSLVKYAESADMYYINGSGQKQKFASVDAFNANRFKLSDVLTISSTLTYTSGADITGAMSALTDTSQGALGTGTVGALSAALASDSPAAGAVPVGSANVPFTYVNLTAGPDGATVTGVKVTRIGLGTDVNFDAVKLFVDGIQVGNSQSLNSAHQASFSGISISVPANTTKKLVLAGNVAAGGVAGHLIGLSLNAAADLTTTAAVSGSFPIAGAIQQVSAVTIGTATLANGSLQPTNGGSVDADAVDFRFNQVRVTAGGTEDVKLTQVTAVRNGTAGDGDVKDVKLYDDTHGTLLGTVATLTGGKAVFSGLNLIIPKGNNIELSVKATLIGGAGRTVGFDLHDGVAYTAMLVGQSYGFGITPTGTFCTTNCPLQTINQGYLTIAKSASTPATGNIALGGNNVALAAFDFKVVGEPVNITRSQVTLTPAGGGSASDYTNVALYNKDGVLVAGPQDGSTTTANTAQNLTYTDAYTLPVGTTTLYVKANVSVSAVAAETMTVSVPANSVTAKGANSGKVTYTTSAGTTVPPAAVVTANTMTLQGASLAVVTAATPVAGNVVVNAQKQVFAYIDLDATAGGEDVKVTQVTVADTLGAGTDYSGVTNLELWGDPDNTDSTAQNVLIETSNSTATNAATVAFTFKSPLKVSHLAVSRLTLKGDVASATGTSHTFDTTSAAAVTSVGWTTGNAIIETYSGGGQAQTVQTVGKLKVEAAADRAAKAQLVAGSTGNATMSYKLTAYYEDVSVTQFYVGTTTGGSTNADVAKIKVYVNGTQVGATSGYTLDSNGRALVTLGPTELVVPKDSYVTLTLKVDLSDKTQLTDAANLEMGVGTGAAGTAVAWTGLDGAAGAAGTYYYFVATGKSSGAVLAKTTMNHNMNAATGYVYGSYIFKLYDGILTVSLSSTQPSTNATAGANKEVMRLDLTATGDDITVNDLEFLNGGTATITGTGVATLYSSDLGTTYTQWASGTAWLAGVDMHVAASGVRHAGGWDVPLVIAAGSTKQVRLFGDTSGAATTLTYQASVDNGTATASGVAWQNSSANAVDSALTKNLPVTGPTLVY